MKPAQLEVLVFSDSRFSERKFCKQYHDHSKNMFARNNSLEEACWNGLFHELVPALFSTKERIWKNMILWRIVRAKNFLQLEYCAALLKKECVYSLNPYLFLRRQNLS